MIVVSDTSPILCLCYLEKLQLLQKLFQTVIIPGAVYKELMGSRLTKEQKENLGKTSWVYVKTPVHKELIGELLVKVDYAEAEAIILAKELKADYLLIDEDAGRKVASSEGIKIMGVLGVLIEAKKLNLIPDLKIIVDELINKVGFHISDKLYDYIIEKYDN